MHTPLPPSPDDLGQIQADSALPNPLQPVTMPVVPPGRATDEQQAFLIQELGRLNTETDNLLQQQPNLETVFQQQLAAIFPALRRPINPNRIFYSRYREDEQGQKHLLTSEPLAALLNALRRPDASAYLAQHPGAFYREGQTLDEDKRLSPGSPVETMAGMLEVVFTLKMNEFWTYRGDAQLDTEAQLVDVRRQVLAHQLALRTVDGTLSAAGRTLADAVLKYPTAAARNQVFAAGQRPGVYKLMLENGSHFAAAFILSATDETPPVGRVMLYSPGEGFEEFKDLGQLNETVAARLGDGESAGKRLAGSLVPTAQAALSSLAVLATEPPLIEADVIAVGIRSLRTWQYLRVRASLRRDTLPVAGELAIAADLTPQLDVSIALSARNLRLAPREPDWLKAASPLDQAAYRQLETKVIDSQEALLPLLENISTLASFSEDEVLKVLKIQKPEYANVDLAPYQSLVRLRVSNSMPVSVTGYRDEASATVYISEDPKIDIPDFLKRRQLTPGSWSTNVVVDLRTLGSYARRNLEPWSEHEIHRTTSATADIVDTSGNKVGTLNNAALRALAQQANVAAKYDEYLRSSFSQTGEGQTFAAAWQRANTAQMRRDALESRLNPAVDNLFTFKTPGSGFDWIQAVIQHPDSATRPPVGRTPIEVNGLVMGGGLERGQGGQPINGVLVIQRQRTRLGGVCVLYTPDAPDDAPFRELTNGLAELDTLKAKPQWRAYFTERMATNDAQELTRIFSDTRSVYRYAVTPITGDLQAYLYSAQLGFLLSHADYRSRSNAEIARESTVNAFLFAVDAADFLLGLSLVKAMRRLLFRYVARGLQRAQKLGRGIPGLIKKIGGDHKPYFALSNASIRPLTPGWVNIAEYRLPKHIDALFDVEDFARTNHYTLSRRMGAPHFIDKRSHQFISMKTQEGRYHLYQSYVEDGARYVKDPTGNRPDFMVVPGDAKSWKPRFERTSIGGGQVLGVLQIRTAEQQLDEDLLAMFRVFSDERGDVLVPLLTSVQKRRLLDHALQQLRVDEPTFRQIVWGRREVRPDRFRETVLTLDFDADIYTHLNRTTAYLDGTVSLSALDKDNLFLKIKRIAGKNDDFSKYIRASITVKDPDTKAGFVGYAFTKKQFDNLNKFDRKFKISTWNSDTLNDFLDEKGRRTVLHKIASEHNLTAEEALKTLMSEPALQIALANFRKAKHKAMLTELGVESFSESFKKSGVPYIALSQGKTTGQDTGMRAVDSVSVTAFEKNIPRYSTPLEFTSTRAQTHKVEKLPGSPEAPPTPHLPPPRDPDINIVKFDELAEAQLPLLPDNARTKVDEIIQDIHAGRVSRKKIGSYTYTDLPQLDAGTGRGRWRMAFENTGKEDGKDVFVFRGIIDYHGSKHIAWGM